MTGPGQPTTESPVTVSAPKLPCHGSEQVPEPIRCSPSTSSPPADSCADWGLTRPISVQGSLPRDHGTWTCLRLLPSATCMKPEGCQEGQLSLLTPSALGGWGQTARPPAWQSLLWPRMW